GGTASIILAPGHQPPTEVVATLSNVSNGQTLTINLLGVSDGTVTGNVHIPMAVLLGDVSGNGAVSNTDVGNIKAQVNPTKPVDQSIFKDDVSCNGYVTNTDVGTTKSQVGTTLP